MTISYKGMDNSDFLTYQQYHRLCRWIGFDSEYESLRKSRRVYIIIFLTLLGVIIQTYILFTSEFELQTTMDLMTTYLPTICFTVCYHNMLYNIKLVYSVRDHKLRDITKLDNEEEIKIMNKYGQRSRLYSLIIACVFYFYMLLLFIPSFLSLYVYISDVRNDTVLVLPVRWEYCLQTRIRYFCMLSLEYFGMTILCSVGVIYYSLVVSCMQHACALFTIVTVKIDRLLKENVNDSRSTLFVNKREKEFKWIISVIESYNNAVDYVDLLLMLCKASYLFEIAITLIILIMDFIYMFRLFDKTITQDEIMKTCMYIFFTTMLIYAAFYMGQSLIDHSSNVYAKCCQIPFYALSKKTQKFLVMLLMRTLKPCSININGMMVTSNEVFAKIANTSYSLAIVCYKTH